MAIYENIKLDKGLYGTSKGFLAELESIDPSENYKGTSLEGLDAFERQLKRFDIKVSGNMSSPVDKFFATTDSAALFPEYISRAVRTGLESADVLSEIIAAKTVIDGLDYRPITSVLTDDDKALKETAEGTAIPETSVKTQENLVKLKKRGRMLCASYEAIRFQKLDLFTVTLKQIGAYISRALFKDAVSVLSLGDGNKNPAATLKVSTAGKLTYSDLVSFWNGFDPYELNTVIASPDIAAAILNMPEMRDAAAGPIGAGDQGMMFGYASDETEEYMPYPIALAHKLARRLTEVRKNGTLPYLRPDGKTQVTVEYDENGVPARLDAVVLSTQHDPDVSQEQIHEDVKKYIFDEILPADMVDENTKFFINPTGRFVIGGPHGDSGLTGRKIIVDTYGGMARHGGGAFSGKDCTKVDRSAAYAARYVAKNIVAAGIAKKCEIQLSYAIGVAQPTSVMVDTFGTGKIADDKLVEIVRENFDLRPAGIIKMLDLRRPIYKQTAAYGHFGRNDLDLPWEKLDKVDTLKKYL